VTFVGKIKFRTVVIAGSYEGSSVQLSFLQHHLVLSLITWQLLSSVQEVQSSHRGGTKIVQIIFHRHLCQPYSMTASDLNISK